MTKEITKRTIPQNKALHLYCNMVADLLKEYGIPAKVILEFFPVYASPETIKSIMREMGNVKFNKTSTGEWNQDELQEVFKEFHEALLHITNGAVDIPFPSLENTTEYLQSYEQ